MLPSAVKVTPATATRLAIPSGNSSTSINTTNWQESFKVPPFLRAYATVLTHFSDMQRFQVPYNLKEIPEVQNYLMAQFDDAKNGGDLHDLYRRRYVFLIHVWVLHDTQIELPS
jgi:hypothetical protein